MSCGKHGIRAVLPRAKSYFKRHDNVSRKFTVHRWNDQASDISVHYDNSFIAHARIHELKMREILLVREQSLGDVWCGVRLGRERPNIGRKMNINGWCRKVVGTRERYKISTFFSFFFFFFSVKSIFGIHFFGNEIDHKSWSFCVCQKVLKQMMLVSHIACLPFASSTKKWIPLQRVRHGCEN